MLAHRGKPQPKKQAATSPLRPQDVRRRPIGKATNPCVLVNSRLDSERRFPRAQEMTHVLYEKLSASASFALHLANMVAGISAAQQRLSAAESCVCLQAGSDCSSPPRSFQTRAWNSSAVALGCRAQRPHPPSRPGQGSRSYSPVRLPRYEPCTRRYGNTLKCCTDSQRAELMRHGADLARVRQGTQLVAKTVDHTLYSTICSPKRMSSGLTNRGPP